MTADQWAPNDHEYFKELNALANSGTLTGGEWLELKKHLQICEECREANREYAVLANEGIPMLAARYSHFSEPTNWDDAAARRKLFARLRAPGERYPSEAGRRSSASMDHNLAWRMPVNPAACFAVAACLILAIGLAAYHFVSRAQAGAKQAQASVEERLQRLAEEKRSGDELLDAQRKRLSALQEEVSRKEARLASLRSALRALEDRLNELTTAGSTADERLRAVSQQRDALSGQLRDVEQAFQKAQTEVGSLRAEREKALLQAATLEPRIDELSVVNNDLQRRLRDDEQYLGSDRDIRDLMGARKLYIADVFDVDSGSRTRKPFGRIFYTEGKSLLFYAFDLDEQPHVKTASAFQAWGERDTGQERSISLGILYKDSELNRRWVLRCDDPERLAEIDAVFVTVEPHGGSHKPTGKRFLYALLRKEPNHP
jgi:hypothetical protein